MVGSVYFRFKIWCVQIDYESKRKIKSSLKIDGQITELVECDIKYRIWRYKNFLEYAEYLRRRIFMKFITLLFVNLSWELLQTERTESVDILLSSSDALLLYRNSENKNFFFTHDEFPANLFSTHVYPRHSDRPGLASTRYYLQLIQIGEISCCVHETRICFRLGSWL